MDGDNAAAYRYCITGDTLVTTNKGLLPIKEISNKKEANINLKIVSKDGKKNKASKFFNSGKHATIKIITQSGYTIEGSHNHPVLVWKAGTKFKPQLQWKLLERIESGDVAVLNRNHVLFSVHPLGLEKYFPTKGFRNNIGLPKIMNNKLAFLLGALVSEGSFHDKQITFNNKDIIFYNEVKRVLTSQFKGIQLYERQIKGNCIELSIYEQKVVEFLKNIGLNKSKADGKVIPFSVLQSTKENIKSFLVALFEGDGSITYIEDKRHGGRSVHVNYDSKSKNLIHQLKVVLLNFGVVSNYPQIDRRHDCSKLVVSGWSNVHQFQREIGFFSVRKKTMLSKIQGINNGRLSKKDFIPFLNDYLRLNYDYSFVRRENFDRYNSLTKNYARLMSVLKKDDKLLIDSILRNRFFFDPVLSVEKSNEPREVFSLRVDSSCHSFVANGFINHNTEARMMELAENMLEDLDKDTVKFQSNFDDTMTEPVVLPSKVPQLLINGSTGIAVGMATNIPPHNLKEVCDATVHLIEHPEASIDELMKYVHGPDFPTGAIITGRSGIVQAYKTGRGKVTVKAVTEIQKDRIIVTEIPYMVNKSLMIEEMADLVRAKRIEGIRNIRDESNRQGIRVVIELKSGVDGNVVLNQLLTYSKLKTTFGIIFLALVDAQPRLMNLKSGLQEFIKHRQVVVRRRTEFELKQAQDRAHILEGLIVALDHVDDVVQGIKKSRTVADAQIFLISTYGLTEIQAKAILELRLQKLASLEQQQIRDEHKELIEKIKEYLGILASEEKIFSIIKKETLEVSGKFANERRTKIEEGEHELLDMEELIEEKEMVVTVTHTGYVKRIALEEYKQQRRGGKGVTAAETKDEDWVERLFVAQTHDYLLCFTTMGQVHWLKVYEIPEASRYAKGKPLVNLVTLVEGEKVTALVPVKTFEPNKYIFMATAQGVVKKTPLESFSRPRRGGIRAITLEDDQLIGVEMTDGTRQIILATRLGMAVRFEEEDVRPMGRNAAGVRGIRLKEGDIVVGMEVADETKTLLTVTNKGYGKRTELSEYRLINRGGSGVTNIYLTDKNGFVVGVKAVIDTDELMFVSKNGSAIRTAAKDISVIGRSTQGVRVMRLDEGDELVAVESMAKEDEGNAVQ
ncbi:MAG TPA: DNA gyrase subunit A [Candidatus Nanoarchaeia archaeon]|nr:DNA gyrase subunit A [Candidatus Nanoarchaeia archaeon]